MRTLLTGAALLLAALPGFAQSFVTAHRFRYAINDRYGAFVAIAKSPITRDYYCSFYSGGLANTTSHRGSCSYGGIQRVSEAGDSLERVIDSADYGLPLGFAATDTGFVALTFSACSGYPDSSMQLVYYGLDMHRKKAVLKLDTLFGDASYQELADLVYANGGIYILGTLYSRTTGSGDYCLARYDLSGMLEWRKIYRLPDSQIADAITPDTGGSLILSGRSRCGAIYAAFINPEGELVHAQELAVRQHCVGKVRIRRMPDLGLLACAQGSASADTSYLYCFGPGPTYTQRWMRQARSFTSNSIWTYVDGTGCVMRNYRRRATDTLSAALSRIDLATGTELSYYPLWPDDCIGTNVNAFYYDSDGNASLAGIYDYRDSQCNSFIGQDPYYLRLSHLGVPYVPPGWPPLGTRPVFVPVTPPILAWPNPTHGAFALSGLAPGVHQVVIADMAGRTAWQGYQDAEGRIAPGLAPGVYALSAAGKHCKLVVE